MKIIVFDLFSAQPKRGIKFHGGGEYIKAIFRVLAEKYCCYSAELELHVCYEKENYIDDWIKKILEEDKFIVHDVNSEREIVDLLYGFTGNQNVTFYTGMIYLYDKQHVKFPQQVNTIGTCHGLRLLEKPYDTYGFMYAGFYDFLKEILRKTICKKYLYKKHRNDLKNAIENFRTIVTVSNHSMYAIKTHIPDVVDKVRLQVLYTPMKISDCRCDTKDDGYIMMVSADRWLKNAYRGITAIDHLYSKKCIFGFKTKVFGNYPEKLKKRIKNREMFEFYGYVESTELEQAYACCSVFFYPTLNEGFGLPPMEAMKYGKTCVVSGVCSLPEVYGESVYYCNPYDIQEMENRILMAVNNRIERDTIDCRSNYISKKQKEDLEKICNLIVS